MIVVKNIPYLLENPFVNSGRAKMARLFDWIKMLGDAKLEIRTTSPPVTNNFITNHYYIVEGDRIIQLTPEQFKRKVKEQKLIVENIVKRIEKYD